MKIFVILAGAAQAWRCRKRDMWDRHVESCDFTEWYAENWPRSAYESFEFISNNWDQFVHAIPSVNRFDLFCKEKFSWKIMKCFRLMRQFCDQFSMLTILMAILYSASKSFPLSFVILSIITRGPNFMILVPSFGSQKFGIFVILTTQYMT